MSESLKPLEPGCLAVVISCRPAGMHWLVGSVVHVVELLPAGLVGRMVTTGEVRITVPDDWLCDVPDHGELVISGERLMRIDPDDSSEFIAEEALCDADD